MIDAPNRVCLYHGSDLDGHCSGAVCKLAHRDTALIPVDYATKIPWGELQDADVTLVDFSMQPDENWDRLLTTARSVLWIDHHRSAIEGWKNYTPPENSCRIETYYREGVGACELAWEHYFTFQVDPMPVPDALHLLSRYDVWDHSDPRTLPFQYGMRVLTTDPREEEAMKFWSELLTGNEPTLLVACIIDTGKSILKYQQDQDAIWAQNWFAVRFEGLRWQCANRLGKGSSFFDSIRDTAYAGEISYSFNGKEYGVGMYSTREDIDCGAIAKKHGGGGHPGAAGFRCAQLPFLGAGA